MTIGMFKVEFSKWSEGCRRGVGMCDKNGLFGFGEVTSSGAEFEEKALCLCNGGNGTNQGAVIGIPRLNSIGD
jgi:hypothetical protein